MDNRLFNIVYTSTAKELFSDEELEDLLKVARANNSRKDVSGMLLYSDGVFMQVLEGEKDNVQQVYDIISADPRHYGVIVLSQSYIDKRSFSEWKMGFKAPSRDELASMSGYTGFLNKDFDASELGNEPSIAMKLMLSFRNNMV
ncbi:BLUF domain-containing protein [Parendozoicomonas haliclonae]|uniref:Blue light-and temperature-regulated antirepressor YcgF n=1 Tax=Parendozoicomonas haliclonae TaxID=1960125 RepID=A0A1X7APS5_9GAMM|nr:BLUF domain-containing protein [Parendozoicomonas haliclonae]SMA50143.1 Blue light-and temperature-regulated antirepressor YcgF [Parendozoicomonas haliclonae]